jgi:hypothetical protein
VAVQVLYTYVTWTDADGIAQWCATFPDVMMSKALLQLAAVSSPA